MMETNLESGIDVEEILSKFPTKKLRMYDAKIAGWEETCSRASADAVENAKLELS
jgi:hypothetical protein